MPRRKKQKLEYAAGDVERVAELEDFLFGSTTVPAVTKGPVAPSINEGEDELNLADLVKGVGANLLFVEDRLGADHAQTVAEWRTQREPSEDRDEGSSEQDELEISEEEERMAGNGRDVGGTGHGDDDADAEALEAATAAQGASTPDASVKTGEGTRSQRLQRPSEAQLKTGGAAWLDPADSQFSVDVVEKARLRKLRSAKAQQQLSSAAFERALRRQHAALNPRTNWAKLGAMDQGAVDGDTSGGEDDATGSPTDDASRLLRTVGGLMAARGSHCGTLPAGSLDLVRLRDANQHAPSDAVVQSLEWHPNGQVMFTAGFDKKLRLFSVDGLRNTLLQTVHLSDCPIHRASWAAGGGAVVAAGRRPFWFLYDLHAARVERCQGPPAPGAGTKPSRSLESFAACQSEDNPLVAFLGDAGHVALVSLRSRQPVGSLKLNGSVRCAAFDSAGSTLITSGGDGIIYTWDLRMMHRAMHLQVDEGNIGATSLALSPDARTLATGSSSGVVNVYRRPQGLGLLQRLDVPALQGGLQSGGPSQGPGTPSTAVPQAPDPAPPARALMNLATAVDTLTFSGDGQLLVMASRLKRDALRVVHVPTLTVYSNWPTSRTPLHYVHSAGFSPGGGFLGIGNAKGHVLLYRITGLPI